MWLAHPVYGDVVSLGISALRQRALARSLAEVTEATGARRRQDTLLVASWRLAGGGGSAELLESGVFAARARHDHALTERLARAAIDQGAGFDARFLAAEAAHLEGRPDQAEHELAALAVDAGSDPSTPASPCSASTTPTSSRAAPNFGSSTRRSTPSPIRPGTTSC